MREISSGIEKLLEKSSVNKDTIDYFLLHQSNHFIIRQIAAQLGVAADKMLVNIADFGNTSGVSIPLVMASYSEKFDSAQKIILSGYGSELNWGNAIINTQGIKIVPMREI
ncbi:3-oxoacyl-[acyl-carrier-protein] synthase III C-terminal domain-containing protein [Flavobacterium sp. 3HN19-14]|uniref:3-oxoacyl-[acyl-carrier-protein] synthase III C-terminal domain-containing protein n=1 Tax=Flavobacterium sp. 3HN19-14 TaxID=3448133 RepID=UPI003EE12E98